MNVIILTLLLFNKNLINWEFGIWWKQADDHIKAHVTHYIFAHNIAILSHNIVIKRYCHKRFFSSKYCFYISKSFQNWFSIHTGKKYWMKNVFLSFYRNIFLFLYRIIVCQNVSCEKVLIVITSSGFHFVHIIGPLTKIKE
jgi:hypothetical protein